MSAWFERFVERFWRHTEVPGREIFRDLDAQYARIVPLFRAYYAFLLWYVVNKAPRGRYFEASIFDPMWPVLWLHFVPWEVGATLIVVLCVGGAAAALLMPHRVLPRVLAFVGLFQFLALWYTYKGVQHRTYTMLYLALFFALAPRLHRLASDDEKRRSLMVVFGGLATLLFTYSWAGALKIWGAVEALVRGDARLLDWSLVPAVFLNRAYRFENPPVLVELVLDHPLLANLGLFAVFYVEFVSMAAAFRPHLQRWWLVLLAGFHVGTLLTMKVFFLPATAMLLILAVWSPFARPVRDWQPALRELPWFGPLLFAALERVRSLFGRSGRTTLFYPEDCGLARTLLRTPAGGNGAAGPLWKSRSCDAFEALCREHPGLLEERDAIVGLHERGNQRTLLLRSQALLHAWTGAGGARSWLFALMIVPLPLLDRLYRRAARRLAGPGLAAGSPGELAR